MDVDLHIHSTASDGSFTPHDILDRARALKLRAISITDHDTVDGVKEIMTPETTANPHVLSGVEISSTPPDQFDIPGNFHILGYGIRLEDPDLTRALHHVRQSRDDRNPRIISRLKSHGIDISMDEVNESSAGDVIGRPHIARVLVQKGCVSSIDEAFDRYLAKGRPCFEDKFRLDCQAAISVIRKAGGIAVLAHPVSLKTDKGTLESLLKVLKGMGLSGIEAYYSNHTPEDTEDYCSMAGKLDLIVTGGSDFHGSYKTNIQMGSGKGNLQVPYRVFERIIEHLGHKSPTH